MKTIFKIIIAAIVFFALVVWAIAAWLGPDDLSGCGTRPTDKKGCAAAQAIVVVSGGDTAARTEEAIKLYRNGWAAVIIFSGAAADKSGPSNAESMRTQAIAEGIPAGNTVVETTSETTEQNAENTVALLHQNDITSIILVTSAYHERRALLEFQKRTASVAIRAHPVHEDKDWNRFWFVSPYGWSLAGSELVKSFIAAAGGVQAK
jgi:uncharacterized SAM-binding protein YcdF (DUF218 family)